MIKESIKLELKEQLRIWNDTDEYLKIIEAIEALSEAERTPELISDLARAYNNYNTLGDIDDPKLYEKAIGLLETVEEYLKDDHNWNFRMAYAYYYLDQEGPALHYFERALEARPADVDTEEFISDCRRRLALPSFSKSFRERTEEGWAAFFAGEAELRAAMDAKESGDELMERAANLLSPAFEDVAFELGFNGEKHELILTPEGDMSKLIQLVYFQKHVPAELLSRWNILVGRRPSSSGFELEAFGQRISAADVRIWVSKAEDKPEDHMVSLALYCEKLAQMKLDDGDRVAWLLSILLDQVIGEIPVMALVDGFEVLDVPRDEQSVSLDELTAFLEQMGLDLSWDANRLMENGYLIYEGKAQEATDADLRLDVFAGGTRCPSLLREYLNDESGTMDAFHRDGVTAGFLYYPLDGFSEAEDRGQAILDFRDRLEAGIQKEAGEACVTFIGGASGLYHGYLDFIAWDLLPVLDAAVKVFDDESMDWAAFHVFRRNVGGISLKDDTEESSDASPQTEL